jgi:hypothetical protein
MNFWREHFDHILLVLLGVIGGIGGIICASHHMDKPSEWCFVEAAAALSALLMRMNGPRVTLPNGQTPTQ